MVKALVSSDLDEILFDIIPRKLRTDALADEKKAERRAGKKKR